MMKKGVFEREDLSARTGPKCYSGEQLYDDFKLEKNIHRAELNLRSPIIADRATFIFLLDVPTAYRY